MARPVLRLLTGPTAAGKTEAALREAEATGAEILSCDAVCVYRGLDIGSAKPTAAERARVPHHGLDLAPPSERVSVADYVRHARAAVDDALRRGKEILVVGGSGFYLSAFLGPVADDLAIAPEVREEVRRLQAAGLAAMRERLVALEGGPLPGWLDADNPLRLAKALERRLASGRSLDVLRTEFLAKPGAFADLEVRAEVLERPDTELRERIHRRTRAMIAGGLIDEARQLQGLAEDLPAPRAVGYREALEWLGQGGNGPKEALAEAIDRSTWALVGSQRKWFRRLGLAPK